MVIAYRDTKIELVGPSGRKLHEVILKALRHRTSTLPSTPSNQSAPSSLSTVSSSATSVVLTAFTFVGTRVWCFTSDGYVHILMLNSSSLTLLGGWPCGGAMYGINTSKKDGHIISACCCGDRVFTLYNDGTIRGWSAHSPGPCDSPARNMMLSTTTDVDRFRSRDDSNSFNRELIGSNLQDDIIIERNINVRMTTWNVAEQKPDYNIMKQWLCDGHSIADDVVVVCLQEIEMGTSR